MRPIPQKHRKILSTDPYFKRCAREQEGTCAGRIEIHHAFIYAGRQINELWAYLPLCTRHHTGSGKNDELAAFLALIRAAASDLALYPRKDWKQLKSYLSSKYESHHHSQGGRSIKKEQ